MTIPLHQLSLLDVSSRLAQRTLGCVELTEHMLERIKRLDPVLRAYARLTSERALAAARRAEAEIARGEHRGPLHGVPIAVKDLCDTAGVVTAAGTTMLADHRPEEDATVVRRLEEAGAVLLGKLVMTEGAGAAHHPDIPPPRNPWDLERWAGASSSGSGVATAAGLCFASLGTDTAGSIRFPSAACGLAGLKPTYGRVSRAGVFPLAATLDHVGPMARSAADVGAVLQVIAGRDPRDPTSSHRPVGRTGPDEVDLASLSRARVGFDERYATTAVDDALTAALEASLRRLEDAGAKIVPFAMPPLEEALDAHSVILSAEVAYAHHEAGHYPAQADAYGPHLRALIEIGLGLEGIDYARAHERRLGFREELAGQMSDVDLLLCPPTPLLPPPQALLDQPPSDFREMAELLRFTAPFDLSGSPALTLRAGFDNVGLPVAVQLVARDFEEPLLVAAGVAHDERVEAITRFPEDPIDGAA